MAVIVLVNRSVRGIYIPWHSILVVYRVKSFIVLKQPFFTFPRPDSCADISIIIGISAIFCIHICATPICHIVLHQWPIRIHCYNSIISYVLDIVIFHNKIRMSICLCRFFRNCGSAKTITLICIADTNSGSGHVSYITVRNFDVMISGNSGFFFIIRLRHIHLDSSIIHMLIPNIAIYIVNVQIIEINMFHRSPVFCNSCHSGTIHTLILRRVRRSRTVFSRACNGSFEIIKIIGYIRKLQVTDLYKIHIIQKNCGRYITLSFVSRII